VASPAAADVLIHADTTYSPELRHEIPLLIFDPFLYAELGGTRHVVISALDAPRLRELGTVEVHSYEEFGRDELVASGLTAQDVTLEVLVRAVQNLGVVEATVPPRFPLALADRLRAEGVALRVERELFVERRRVKNEQELAGIRRAQRAAEAGMDAARTILSRAARTGRTTTSEEIKAAIDAAFVEHACAADDSIVAHGSQSAIGHDMGSGTISPGEPIVIDLWPRDRVSGCYADMSRTFVIGDPPDEIAEWHALVKTALTHAFAQTRAGISGRLLFDGVCEIFEHAGFRTQRTKEKGGVVGDGFIHSLGHGVGLAVHEEPAIGMTADRALVAGEVVTLEPGLYRQGYGGVRLEDLVLVTNDAAENLTSYPYDLEP
jgi:Xaa-Pro aminopeptidase